MLFKNKFFLENSMAPKCYICNFCVKKNTSLFRIPDRNDLYSERCGLWLKLLEQKSENMHKIRICSVHFLKSKTNFYLENIYYIYTTST